MKRGLAFAPKVSRKCDLAYLQPQSDLKQLVQNHNHYKTELLHQKPAANVTFAYL